MRLVHLVIIIMLLPSVFSLGVAPSSKEILYEPGAYQYPLKIIGKGSYMIQVEGVLKDYIQIQDRVEIPKETTIYYNITIPDIELSPGRHETKIIVKEIKESDSMVSSSVNIISKIFLVVPYPDKYIEVDLFIPNVKPGVESNIAIEFSNLGTGSVEALVFLDIDDEIPLGSILVEPNQKKSVIYHWIPKPGIHEIKAYAKYDGKTAIDKTIVTISEPAISIEKIVPGTFKLGTIARFDIHLKSTWNEVIGDVYAIVDINGTRIATNSIDLDKEGVITAHWDTKDVKSGVYDMLFELRFDGSSYQEQYYLTVFDENLIVSKEKAVQESQKRFPWIIIISVTIFIGIIIFIIFKKKFTY